MSQLLLWLEGPLQSWGADSRYGARTTLPFPTRSGVLGLLCSATGRRGEQRDWLAHMASLGQTVRSYTRVHNDRIYKAPILVDFHMVGSGYDSDDPWQNLHTPKTSEGKKPVGSGAKMTYRHYLQDSAFACALEVPEDEANNGIVTVTVGEGANTAAAKLQVTKIAKTPSIMVKPESVTLNSNGDAVDVEVVTNVDSWDIVPESGDTDVITASKKDEKTISVSASSLTAGDRTATFTIKAGEVSATLTVVQRVKMNVGDPFVVNGKTVGIVYEVDAEGMHGKAFSLTVKNICDMYFFKASNDEWVELPDGNWTMIPGVTMEDSYTPRNTTNGLANSQTMKTAPDWENHFQMLKWVEDLGKEQGVEWYIPAIEELKAVVEYMSNAKFITTTDEFGTTTTKLDDSDPAKIETAWDNIRKIYSDYSTETSTEQYVVFQAINADYTAYIDCRHPNEYDDNWTLIKPGDDGAYRWISSTVVKPEGMRDGMSYTVHTKNYATDPYAAVYDWHVPAIFEDAGWGDDFDQYGCSIHPICQF